MPEPQNFKNHGRVAPMYHVGVFFPLAANAIWAFARLRDGVSGEDIVDLAVAIALLLMFYSVRVQILTVQDRVIRLEMRQRFRELLTPELFAQATALPVKQVIALRFASDAELPALLRDVAAGTVATPKEIKQRVKDWQADYLRA